MLSSVMDVLIGALSVALALLLISAGIHKAIDRTRMIHVLREFAGIPARWTQVALLCTVLLETGAGIALALPHARPSGALIATFLWVVYAALLLRTVLAGRRDVDCGCRLHAGSESIGNRDVLRTMALAAMAALIALTSRAGMPDAMHWLLNLAAGFTCYAMYCASDALLELHAPLRSPQ
jgi:hypothetical protein